MSERILDEDAYYDEIAKEERLRYAFVDALEAAEIAFWEDMQEAHYRSLFENDLYDKCIKSSYGLRENEGFDLEL